eukprot:TRINITY_DN1030_c0_g1_i15.p1 TRINITY_DN1030_c0_g1~~TRINITY_DN1030_c0_g1_i15.p1  ORF type:complete len:136 (+),score=4.39 TRINITY_DN1030_c0_g1_i15:27-410(+)
MVSSSGGCHEPPRSGTTSFKVVLLSTNFQVHSVASDIDHAHRFLLHPSSDPRVSTGLSVSRNHAVSPLKVQRSRCNRDIDATNHTSLLYFETLIASLLIHRLYHLCCPFLRRTQYGYDIYPHQPSST